MIKNNVTSTQARARDLAPKKKKTRTFHPHKSLNVWVDGGTWKKKKCIPGSLSETEGGAKEKQPLQSTPNDILCFTDYDVTAFHRNAVPLHRLSLTSPASVLSVSQRLLYEVPCRSPLTR